MKWEINNLDGKKQIVSELLCPVSSDQLYCNITVLTQWWDKGLMILEPEKQDSTVVCDSEIKFKQYVYTKQQLSVLCDAIRAGDWERGLVEIVDECEFNKTKFTMKKRNQSSIPTEICDLSVYMESCGLRVCVDLVLDQSCLKIWADGLVRVC